MGGRKSNSSCACTQSKMKSLYRTNPGREALFPKPQIFSDLNKYFLLV